MCPLPDDCKIEIENALELLAKQKGQDFVERIRPILLTNLERGRVQFFIEGDLNYVRDYVWKVAENYGRLEPFIHELQLDKASELWGPLVGQMQSWARNFFRRKNFRADAVTEEIASDCANDAAINMVGAYFPYDTDFEPWARVIVHNACRKYIRKETQKSAIPQNELVEIDDSFDDCKQPIENSQVSQEELQNDIREALGGLSEPRREVLEMEYFKELKPVEIAQKMGKSLGAVYNLKFKALEDLRKILAGTRYNVNG